MLPSATPDSAVFKAYIDEASLKKIGNGHYALLVYQLNCQAYSIYFNNTFLGSVGDMQTARSNIWNSANHFFIDTRLLRQNNELRIEIKSLYDIGFSSMPLCIVDCSVLNSFLGRVEFLAAGINLLSIGLTVFGSIIVFMLFLISTPRNTAYLYFSAALLFITIFTLDYLTFYNLPFDYFTYKKVILLALYLSVAAVSMGMYKLFHNKAARMASIVTLSGMIAIAFFSKNMTGFKSIYNYYNFTIAANTLIWLYTTCKGLKKSDEAKMFFAGNIVFMFFAVFDAYVTLSGRTLLFRTPFAYTFIFSTLSIILFFSEMAHKESQLESIRLKQYSAYRTSITDGMTGLYNHAYMVDMLRKAAPPYSVVMLDIDDFKEINDSFGHRIGDTVICHVAHSLKNQVLGGHLLFRYGGDEFFLILFRCTAEDAKEMMLKFKESIEKDCPMQDEKPIPLRLSAGIYYVEKAETPDSIFDKVDSALYHSKNSGKNNISVYNRL